jgi:hypothetical protein
MESPSERNLLGPGWKYDPHVTFPEAPWQSRNDIESRACKHPLTTDGDLEHCGRGTMRPTTIRRLEVVQFIRAFLISGLLLAGIGAAISFGSSALQLMAMR